MYDSNQFREIIIQPVCEFMQAYSKPAENILIMTMGYETDGGKYLRQMGHGPAFGPYQMERNTFNGHWPKLLNKYPNIAALISMTREPKAEDMQWNLLLSTVMARFHYLLVPEPIPTNIPDMAVYCKKYWNTYLGKATPKCYLNAYLEFEQVKA